MAVYLDLLALINFAFNFALLTVSGWMGLQRFSLGRYGASSLAGTAFWLIFFFAPKYIFINWLCRIAGGLAMTYIAWRPAGLRALLSKSVLLVVAGQLVGGGIYSLAFFLDSAPLGQSRGVPLAVAAAGGTLMLAVAAWWAGRIHRTKSLASYTGEVIISWGGKTVSIPALLDSGNTLRHPVNSWPVVILERKAAAGLLEEEVLNWLEQPLSLPPEAIANKVALIPYTSLGARGLLAAVRPDRLVISGAQGSRVLTQVYVAVRQKNQPPLEHQALAFPAGMRKEGGLEWENSG
jgi:stage II sporulation protein GA (sporulation sigma-E factor processing peptidase)